MNMKIDKDHKKTQSAHPTPPFPLSLLTLKGQTPNTKNINSKDNQNIVRILVK